MESFILIRKYVPADEVQCQELISNYIMSFAWKSFITFCYKSVTLKLIVFMWSILFIFFGVPMTMCVLTIPGGIFLIYLSAYSTCYARALELMRAKPNQCLVAESFEPFLSRDKITNYVFYENDAPFDESYKNRFRKKIVGTISVKNHLSNDLKNTSWIYKFGIDPNYSFSKIAEPMLKMMENECRELGYRFMETAISEFQIEERDFYDALGYRTLQIYHKSLPDVPAKIIKARLRLPLYPSDPDATMESIILDLNNHMSRLMPQLKATLDAVIFDI